MSRQLFMKWSVCAVLLVLSGCSSTGLTVRIDPGDVDMRSVSVDGRVAEVVGPGTYLGSVSVDEGQERSVRVLARSSDGVEQEQQEVVIGGQKNSATIRMPAEVHVNVGSGRASEVHIDGEPVEPDSNGLYKRRFDPGDQRISVKVTGRGADDTDDEDTVSVSAGEVGRVTLEFGLKARFDMSHDAIVFGEEVEFDAGESGPADSIVQYRWSFGDGSPPLITADSLVRHSYSFDPARGEDTEFRIELTVVDDDGNEDKVGAILPASLDRTRLEVGVQVFPSHRAWHHPGEPIQLKLTPAPGLKPSSLADVVIDFGDGRRQRLLPPGAPISLDCEDDACPPFLVEHTYAAAGMYEPRLTYSHGTAGLEGPFEADLVDARGETPELAIVPVYPTPKQLEDQAWADAFQHIDTLLTESCARVGTAEPHQVKLALTSLQSANFEQDSQTVEVLDRLTHLLVGAGYHVMEKKSSVLARLAFESVIDMREERKSGGAPGLEDSPFYRQHLQYGLVTEGTDDTLHYGVRIEGTNARLTQLDQLDGETASEVDLSEPDQSAEQTTASEHSGKSLVAYENMPIYMARFDTAEMLLAVHVLAPPELIVLEDASFNPIFGESESQRLVSLALRVRLLDRTGRILETRDVIGQASGTVIPRYETRPVVELPVFGD